MILKYRYILELLLLMVSVFVVSCGTAPNSGITQADNFYDFVKMKSQKVWNYDKEQKQEIAKDLYIRGLSEYSDEKYVSAILYFETALKYEQNSTLHLMLAESYMQIRDVDNSLYHSLQVFLNDTNNTRALQLMFSGFIMKNDIEAAEKTIIFIQSKDQNIDNTAILADFYSYTKPEKAIEIYDNLYFRTENPEFGVKLLDLIAELGNYKESVKRSYQYLENKFNYDFLIRLFDHSTANNYYDYLIKYYSELYPKYDEEAKKLSADLFQDLNYYVYDESTQPVVKQFYQNNALKYLQDLYDLNDASNFYLNERSGYYAIAEGDTSLAINFWKKALMNCDTCKILPIVISYYYGLTNKIDSSIIILKEFASKFPEDSIFLLEIGYRYTLNKEYSKAVNYLTNYLAKNPNHIEALNIIADCYSYLNKDAEAEKYYLKGLKIDPENPTINNNYAYLLTKRKDRLQDALKFSEKALKYEPNNGAYLDTYGWVLFRMGNYEKAKEYLEKALLTGFDNCELYEHLYEVNFKLGFYNEAYKYLQKALILEPNNADYKNKLKEIEKKVNK